MAKVVVLSWGEIPSMIEARGPEGRHKIELSARFQELIDMMAMRRGLAGTDQYLEEWRRGRPQERDGAARDAAEAAAAEIEARFDEIRAAAIVSLED